MTRHEVEILRQWQADERALSETAKAFAEARRRARLSKARAMVTITRATSAKS